MGGQRRKKGGRVTPKGCGPVGRLTPKEKDGLEGIFARILRSAPKDLTDDLPPLAVEAWASQMWSIWHSDTLVGMDAEAVFAGGLIAYTAERTTPAAMVILRGLATIAPEPYRAKARRAADRLAAAGVAEPAWAEVVGRAAPSEAWLSHDPVHDDGVGVIVGFDGPADAETVGIYVDHNLGGIAKDAFAVPTSIDEVLRRLRANPEFEGVEYRPVALAEAAARWRDAFAMTDMTLEPPVDEDLQHLRSLVLARLATMPAGGEVPEPPEMDAAERKRLMAEFLESDETGGLWGIDGEDEVVETVEHLAAQMMTFSFDYMRGTPLRFSPVMAEMFCLDWAPRKIAADEDGFTLLPDLLAAWIRFAGRHRGIPEQSIGEAVEAAYGYAPEMIELSQDPSTWGPAKIMALAISDRGIDITDQAALDGFVAEVNRTGGIDLLANSLVGHRR